MRLRLPVLLTVSALLAPLAIGTPAQAAKGLPKVLTGTSATSFQVRPAVIEYTGDGTGVIGGTDGTSIQSPGHLRWTEYSKTRGRATGSVWVNDCEPDCASGTFAAVPVSVRVSSPKYGRFQRLTLAYTYNGKRYIDRRKTKNYGKYWGYEIL